MSVRKYKIDVSQLPPAEIDPQGEYAFRDPATGAAALLAPTREGDRLIPLLGGLDLDDAATLHAKIEIIGALGRADDGRLTVDGAPIIDGSMPVSGASRWGSTDATQDGASRW